MMTPEQACRFIDDVECGRYSAECPEHAEIVHRDGGYYLEYFDGETTEVVDEVDMGEGNRSSEREERR